MITGFHGTHVSIGVIFYLSLQEKLLEVTLILVKGATLQA